MILPQEIQLYYLIPAIRRHIVLILNRKGVQQKEIAKKLYLTQAAVSQYLKGKRGKELKLPKELIKAIEKSAQKIIKENNFMKELIRLVQLSKKLGIICTQCKKFNKIKLCQLC